MLQKASIKHISFYEKQIELSVEKLLQKSEIYLHTDTF